ncbi:MAG: S9 family peptidase [Pseudomonadota bacterium]
MKRLLMIMLLAMAGSSQTQAQTADDPAEIPLQNFAELPHYSQISISPSGKDIAFLLPVKGKYFLFVKELGATKDAVMIPPFNDTNIKWFRWVNENYLAVAFNYPKDRKFININGQSISMNAADNLEQTLLFAFKRDGSNVKKPIQLARPERVSSRGTKFKAEGSPPLWQDIVIDWLPDEPNHFLLMVDADFNWKFETRKVDVRNGKYKIVQDDAMDPFQWVTDQGHEFRFGLIDARVDDAADEKREGIYRMPNGEFKNVSDAQWFKDEFRPVGFDKDPRFAIALGPVDGNMRGVVRIDMIEGKIVETIYANEQYDAGAIFDRQTGELVGIVSPGEPAGYRYMENSRRKLRTGADRALKGRDNYIATLTPDKTKIIFHSSSDQDPGTLYMLDRTTKQLAPLANTMPGLDQRAMAPMERFTYQARDGFELSGFVTLPNNFDDKPVPLVVMPHGGPWGRTGWGFDFLVQAIASRGIAVVQPNFRGSTGQGEDFVDAGKKQWGGKMQDDVTDAVLWAVEQGYASKDNVCIVGWSYGGYAALMGAVKDPDFYRCAASINGVADLKRLRAEANLSRAYRNWVDENIGLEGERLTTVSPYHQAARIKAPTLIVHAKDDNRVPVEHGKEMAERLQELGKPVSYVEVAEGEHSMMNSKSRLEMLTALEGFLLEHLKVNRRVKSASAN